MKHIATAFSDHVNHTTGGTSVLCIESAALNLNFADELERNGALTSKRRITYVRNFHTIDDESVLGTAGTIDGIAPNAARRVVAVSTGHTATGTAGSHIEDNARCNCKN